MSKNPIRYFKTSPEIIQLGVLMYVRFPLSLRNVEDLLHERSIDVCHESVRLGADRFGIYFANKIRKRRTVAMHLVNQWCWHLDEVFVKIRGETHYLWRAVDHEGEVLECVIGILRGGVRVSTTRLSERNPEADFIRTSGHMPQRQAGHMTASLRSSPAQTLLLQSRGRPHMTAPA